ncbi:MAG: bifunctional adenosylcobinamide kinase/adenosylcobinamide-phosphate guanylyltransferase [Gammaproteobacteria bacterium]|jgi:adenosylcobinamide kinase/adenosylcobinamide-phosphate guanylyltransferase|nr:bifunctional adenosylcobinamide kinase/adenosylcobinamide-phosphate guanylyltransferase [Gammaproteobacteria bacterium]
MTSSKPLRHLYLGGARSGKSKLAEAAAHLWLQQHPTGRVVYIATAQIWDQEMQARIDLHQQRRPASWQLLEQPLQLADTLAQLQTQSDQPTCVLVDCLTLWLSNQLCQTGTEETNSASLAEQAIAELVARVSGYNGPLLLVSNEVGSGIVPMGELSRQFQDLSGLMNQRLAEVCDKVTLAVAGLPMVVK